LKILEQNKFTLENLENQLNEVFFSVIMFTFYITELLSYL